MPLCLRISILAFSFCAITVSCKHAEPVKAGPATTFSANFEDGKQGLWWPRETGWSVKNGELGHHSKMRGEAMIGIPGLTLAKTNMTADIRLAESPAGSWIGLLIAAKGPLFQQGEPQGYLLRIDQDRKLTLLAEGDTLDAAQLPDTTSTSLRLDFSLDDGRLSASVNGKLLLSARDRRFTQGEVAVIDAASNATFGLIAVTGHPIEETPLQEVRAVQPEIRHKSTVTTPTQIKARGSSRSIRAQMELSGAPGLFIKEGDAAPFVPLGFNYVRFAQDGAAGRKVTFNKGIYRPGEVEDALAAMRGLGANTVRVAAWGFQDKDGFTGSATDRGLNPDYVENFIDFLRCAAAHELRVVAVLEGVPRNAYYNNAGDRADGGKPSALITGGNCEFLAPAAIAAKRAAIFDFLHAMREADPALLRVVLGWELSGEAMVRTDQGPFRFADRKVTPANGNEYDLSIPEQRQACWDESLLHWANELANAVHTADPQALVGVGMWTADAQGRAAVKNLPTDQGDPRTPARPAVLAQTACSVDFIDLHLYDWDGAGTVDATAHEWPALIGSGKPVLVGETGVLRKRHEPAAARDIQTTILLQSKTLGYQGALLWSWDLTEGPGSETYSGQDEGMADYFRTIPTQRVEVVMPPETAK